MTITGIITAILIGIVVGAGSDAGDVEVLRDAVLADGNVPLLIGPHGGEVAGATVQRTFATARSVEFDALVLTDAPVPGPDVPPPSPPRTTQRSSSPRRGPGPGTP